MNESKSKARIFIKLNFYLRWEITNHIGWDERNEEIIKPKLQGGNNNDQNKFQKYRYHGYEE
jgi:hypothetical protein